MAKPTILRVADNAEKAQTYRIMMSRFNKAVKAGFFCEAMTIEYAMLEDRLRSVLYHMAILPNRSAPKVWKKNRDILTKIVEEYKTKDESSSLGITNICGKSKIVRCVLLFVSNADRDYREDKYLHLLKSQLEGTDLDLFMKTVEGIDSWKDNRNEIVHAMLNKNVLHMETVLKEIVEQGIKLARDLDSQIDLLKKGNKIRRGVNLSMN